MPVSCRINNIIVSQGFIVKAHRLALWLSRQVPLTIFKCYCFEYLIFSNRLYRVIKAMKNRVLHNMITTVCGFLPKKNEKNIDVLNIMY